jgi:antitoxin HigA-1
VINRDELSQKIGNEKRVYSPIHPGEILRLEWLEPLQMSVSELARRLAVPHQRLGELVRGKRAISANMALRLARWSGMRASFWLGLQSTYDLQMAEWTDGERIFKEVRPPSHTPIP